MDTVQVPHRCCLLVFHLFWVGLPPEKPLPVPFRPSCRAFQELRHVHGLQLITGLPQQPGTVQGRTARGQALNTVKHPPVRPRRKVTRAAGLTRKVDRSRKMFSISPRKTPTIMWTLDQTPQRLKRFINPWLGGFLLSKSLQYISGIHLRSVLSSTTEHQQGPASLLQAAFSTSDPKKGQGVSEKHPMAIGHFPPPPDMYTILT